MLENPFLNQPSAARAWAEGFTKAFLSRSAPEPGEAVGIDDIDVFNKGVAAGEESATNGFEADDPCIPALDEHGPLHTPAVVIDVGHIAHGAWEARRLSKLAAGVTGIVVGLIELACSLPVRTLPPEEVLPRAGQQIVDTMASFGLDSVELFCGAGLDPSAADCEIRLI